MTSTSIPNISSAGIDKPVSRLLIVDDNRTYCNFLTKYLSTPGKGSRPSTFRPYKYKVEYETKAANTIRRIAQCNPHVVILDHYFANQKETGYTVFWRIVEQYRERLKNHTLGIIYYSRYQDSETVEGLEDRIASECMDEGIGATIRLRHEYESPKLLEYDIFNLLRGIVGSQPEELSVGDCQHCSLHFNFLEERIYRGMGHHRKPLFNRKKIARNVFLLLADPAGQWRHIAELGEYCWSGPREKQTVAHYLNKLPDVLMEETGCKESFNQYIERSDGQYRMRTIHHCDCG